MTARTDGALAAVVLVAFVVGLVATGTSPSPSLLALGAAAMVAFEAVASRDPEAIRRHWQSPGVRLGAVGVGLALAAVGAVVAPSVVLSAGVGALGAYLLALVLVESGALARLAAALSPKS